MKKIFGNHFYIHRDYLSSLDSEKLQRVEEASKASVLENFPWNIVKICDNSITFSHYLDFYTDPHPAMSEYVFVSDDRTFLRKYDVGNNPPILHRKELFIEEGIEMYSGWERLTFQEISAGLYQKGQLHSIGNKRAWEKLMLDKGVEIRDGVLYHIGGGEFEIDLSALSISRGNGKTDYDRFAGAKSVNYHRKLWEMFHGQELSEGMEVHHIDGDHKNNSIENLVALTKSEHRRTHSKSYKLMGGAWHKKCAKCGRFLPVENYRAYTAKRKNGNEYVHRSNLCSVCYPIVKAREARERREKARKLLAASR